MSEMALFLERVLDGAALRQRVLANNLANESTPGFVRQDVEFRQALVEAVESGKRGAVGKAEMRVYEDTEARRRPDGNSVSLQKELGQITENGLVYNFAAKAMQAKHRGLLKAINSKP